jgi:hypothetical protein
VKEEFIALMESRSQKGDFNPVIVSDNDKFWKQWKNQSWDLAIEIGRVTTENKIIIG